MDTLGINATPEEVDLMVDEIDQDNNGEIDFGGTVLLLYIQGAPYGTTVLYYKDIAAVPVL